MGKPNNQPQPITREELLLKLATTPGWQPSDHELRQTGLDVDFLVASFKEMRPHLKYLSGYMPLNSSALDPASHQSHRDKDRNWINVVSGLGEPGRYEQVFQLLLKPASVDDLCAVAVYLTRAGTWILWVGDAELSGSYSMQTHSYHRFYRESFVVSNDLRELCDQLLARVPKQVRVNDLSSLSATTFIDRALKACFMGTIRYREQRLEEMKEVLRKAEMRMPSTTHRSITS